MFSVHFSLPYIFAFTCRLYIVYVCLLFTFCDLSLCCVVTDTLYFSYLLVYSRIIERYLAVDILAIIIASGMVTKLQSCPCDSLRLLTCSCRYMFLYMLIRSFSTCVNMYMPSLSDSAVNHPCTLNHFSKVCYNYSAPVKLLYS
jgi:hypothetical protein